MSKNSSKKTRLSSLNARRIVEKVYDVTLSEFADSDLPAGKGRLKKASSVISHVRQISTSEDIDVIPVDDDGEVNSVNVDTISVVADAIEQNREENNNQYTEYPVKIWLLLAEYIRPEDVKSFSLICKTTLSVVNTASFWIRLYKRCYRKADIPKCLSRQCLAVKKCLKQKVVRSLFYYYPPYALSVINNNAVSNESLIGTMCIHHGIQSLEEKESNEELSWLYTFKLCDKGINESLNHKQSYGINYNPEARCRLLKFICKEFIVIPSVRGMRLRKMDCSAKTTMLKFSSAPLSKVNSELGTVTIHLDHAQKPVVIPWWHPDYWDHQKCCNKKTYKLPVSC